MIARGLVSSDTALSDDDAPAQPVRAHDGASRMAMAAHRPADDCSACIVVRSMGAWHADPAVVDREMGRPTTSTSFPVSSTIRVRTAERSVRERRCRGN